VQGGGVESAVQTARAFVDEAISLLEDVPDTPSAQGMREAATELVSSLD